MRNAFDGHIRIDCSRAQASEREAACVHADAEVAFGGVSGAVDL